MLQICNLHVIKRVDWLLDLRTYVPLGSLGAGGPIKIRNIAYLLEDTI
jgi:hypothetical protein